jgi:hypothetical protein
VEQLDAERREHLLVEEPRALDVGHADVEVIDDGVLIRCHDALPG